MLASGMDDLKDNTGLSGIWPDEFRDQLALVAVLVLVPVIAVFELVVVGPFNATQDPDLSLTVHALFAVFLAINFYGNLWKLIRTPANGAAGPCLPSVQRAGWRFCAQCRLNAPPRARHCPVCNVCILRRDHHSSFVGKCVGWANQRYYLCAVLYAQIAGIYAVWWHWGYLMSTIGGLRLGTFWFLVTPHIAFILQFIGFVQLVTIMLCMSVLTIGCVVTYLLTCQVFCIYRGQTRHEYLLGINTYDLGPGANLNSVLGEHSLIALLMPFMPSPIKGDGLSYEQRGSMQPVEESVKDL